MLVAARILGLVAVVALCLLAAGCGGKSPGPGVAQVTTASASPAPATSTEPATRESKMQSLVRFAACMRSHGVPSFPDPVAVAGGGMRVTVGPGHGTDPSSPQFKSAHKVCEKLLPGGKDGGSTTSAGDQPKLLQFAACMRTHGMPSFPDPQTAGDGGIKIEGGKSGGLNPSSAVFQAARKVCQHLLPGGGPGVSR